MVYQLIEKMKVDELKDFLRLRRLRVSGNKIELVARVLLLLNHSKQLEAGGSRFFPVVLVPSLFSASLSLL